MCIYKLILSNMKTIHHQVKIFIYNPQNLKEVIGTRIFHIEYVPTEDWYRYHILVDGFYRGYDINMLLMNESKQSPRSVVASSILKCLQKEQVNCNRITELNFPNWGCLQIVLRMINEKLICMADFKNRDELTKYGIILNKKKKLLINETT